MSTLKKQLEEKERLLTAEQEVATTAKSRLREISKVNQELRSSIMISVRFIPSGLMVCPVDNDGTHLKISRALRYNDESD